MEPMIVMTAARNDLLNDVSVLSLRCFMAVVETQSFSSAARQLRISASSVTKNVQLLERSLKVALVYRTTRRISVTEPGERFYDQCRDILASIDGAAAVVSTKDIAGSLRVTSPPSFTAAVLGPHIHEFLTAHKSIALDVLVTSAVPDLVRDRIDVAIILQEAPQSKLAHFLLGSSERAICASPSYLQRCGVPMVPSDLMSHECLSGRFSELAETWNVSREGDWEGLNISSRLLSDNGDLLRQSCVLGAGLGNFYLFHVKDDLENGRLVRVLSDFTVMPKNIYAVIPHRQLVRPQTKAFIDFVRGLVHRNPEPALDVSHRN
jgi:DNA-binding transcriptional LysR family regulator